MSTITKERIEQYANDPRMCNVNDEIRQIALIALASLEAEPYGYVHKAAYEQAGSCGLSGDHEAYRDSSTHIAVYTTPPAPVSVPDAYVRDERGRMMLNGRQEPRIGYGAGWNGYRAAMFRGADGNTQVIPDCTCRTCRPVTFSDSRFVVCPDCGNKRCPHANDHRHACTGSNESGQEGSAYPAAPQQEVK
ncbi:TPA: hypothetical protein ACNTEI_000240 [Escherichia coli]|uniref:hypothetical protein n=1 Tax=Escherichia coli TaxID=562 RepID=UPI00202122A0|nr:hypothetical protein [Escherichia coli]